MSSWNSLANQFSTKVRSNLHECSNSIGCYFSLPVYVQFAFLSSGNRSWIWMVCRKVKSCWQGKTTLPVTTSRKMVRLLSWTTSEKGISRAYELSITYQPLVDCTLISLQWGISVLKSPCSSFIPTTWWQSALSHIFFQPPLPRLRDDLEFVETEQVITCFRYITCFFFVLSMMVYYSIVQKDNVQSEMRAIKIKMVQERLMNFKIPHCHAHHNSMIWLLETSATYVELVLDL